MDDNNYFHMTALVIRLNDDSYIGMPLGQLKKESDKPGLSGDH